MKPTIPFTVTLFLVVVLIFDGILGWMIYDRLLMNQLPAAAEVLEDATLRVHKALLFFLPFNLFAVGWILEILSLKVFGHGLEPDVMRFGQNGSRVWARFPRVGPIKFTLGGLLVVSFLLVFAVFFAPIRLTSDLLMRVWYGLGVLGIVLLVGKMGWNRMRSFTVVYDPVAETLTIPGGAIVRRSQVKDWEVEEIRGKAEKPLYFRPVVHYHDGDGVVQKAVGLTLPSREEAYRFIDWLVRHLELK